MDILEYCNENKAIEIAHDIIQHVKKINKDNKDSTIDFNFNISKGQTVDVSANTWIMFDVENGSLLQNFTRSMYSRDMNEKELLTLDIWMNKICYILMDTHMDALSDVIRKYVIPDADPRIFPLKNIKIENMDIVDFSSIPEYSKYTIKFKKIPGSHINMQLVMQEVQRVYDQTQEDMEIIIEKEKLNGNKVFENIIGVEKGEKYLHDVSISLWVDYAPIEKSEAEKIVNGCKKDSYSINLLG